MNGAIPPDTARATASPTADTVRSAGAPRRVSVVLNARASGLIRRDLSTLVDDIARRFADRGVAASCRAVQPAALHAAFEAAARDPEVDGVIVMGGDGTIATAAQTLAPLGTAMGILPLGNFNLLARDLMLPLELDGAIDTICRGHTRQMDLAFLNDRVFLCVVVLGLFGRMAQLREDERGRAGLQKYLRMARTAWTNLREARPVDITISGGDLDGRRFHSRTITVANNAYDSQQGPFPIRSRLDGGRFVLYVVRGTSRWAAMRLILGIFSGLWRRDEQIDRHETVAPLSLSWDKRTHTVMLDGEPYRVKAPLRFEMHSRALTVFAAAGSGSEPDGAPGSQVGTPPD